MGIKIHKGTIDDVETLVCLAAEWARDRNAKCLRRDIRDQMMGGLDGGEIIIATDRGIPVGFIVCHVVYNVWSRKKTAFEHYVYVNKEARKKGVADMLIDAYQTWAKDSGCSYVVMCPNKSGSDAPEKVASYLSRKGYETYGYMMRRQV